MERLCDKLRSGIDDPEKPHLSADEKLYYDRWLKMVLRPDGTFPKFSRYQTTHFMKKGAVQEAQYEFRERDTNKDNLVDGPELLNHWADDAIGWVGYGVGSPYDMVNAMLDRLAGRTDGANIPDRFTECCPGVQQQPGCEFQTSCEKQKLPPALGFDDYILSKDYFLNIYVDITDFF